jgi:4-hydroxybenzoate polyprenyltransferase
LDTLVFDYITSIPHTLNQLYHLPITERACYNHLVQLRRLISISRPRFWIYELGPYIVGIALASGNNYAVWTMLPVMIFFLFFTYPANLYIYGINDIYDYETDKLNPKKVSYESLVLPEERGALFLNISLLCTPFVLYALLSIGRTSFVVLILFFFFAGFYSAPPIRAKARPILDSIFSAGHYVATALFSYLLVAEILSSPISWSMIATVVLAGMCWSMAMHAYSAVPDIESDQTARLSTIATKLGKKTTIVVCAVLYAISGVLVFPYLGSISLALSSAYVILMLLSLSTSRERLFELYTYFPIVNSIAGMIIFFSILF